MEQIINNRKIQAYSCYYSNITKDMINYQKKVFDLFGMSLTQELTQLQHSIYLDSKIKSIKDFDIIIFFDIDCIPLKPGLYEYIVDVISDNNSIIGIEQQANHIQPLFIYAGPACLAFTKEVYEKLNKPTLAHGNGADGAGHLTLAARKNNVNVKLFNIVCSNDKQWACGNKFFGLGTTYDDWIYHQFGSSSIISNFQFINKCKEILKKYGS
jgi:hypothetical protein